MIEAAVMSPPSEGSGCRADWGVARLGDLVAELGGVVPEPGTAAGSAASADGRDLLVLLTGLEQVKAAAAAAQARATSAFEDWQEQATTQARAAAKGQGFEAWQAARDSFRGSNGTAEQVGLARRLSPWQGSQAVSRSRALVRELPCTLAALASGVLSESRAAIVVRETSHLSVDHRAVVDRQVCGDLDAVAKLGDRGLERAVRAAAYRCDPQGAVDRARVAQGERRVGIRPLPDTMCRVSALLPLAQGVATYAALSRDADTARAGGDARSRGQVMADTLVERVTGQVSAAAVPVEVQVVISDAALLGVSDDPAELVGYGAVPAGWARDLVCGPEPSDSTNTPDTDNTAGSWRSTGREGTTESSYGGAGTADIDRAGVAQARVWLRRLYATPDGTTLVAMESTRRLFDAGLRRFLIARDGTCRTPWCDAPIRHLDHVREHTDGGATAERNGQGLCERCNYTKQLDGWRADVLGPPGSNGRHRVRWQTPIGFTYDSAAPPLLPGARPRAQTHPAWTSPIEIHFAHGLAA
jgi:hypothetical protein